MKWGDYMRRKGIAILVFLAFIFTFVMDNGISVFAEGESDGTSRYDSVLNKTIGMDSEIAWGYLDGIVSDELLNKQSDTITFEEYCGLITNMFSLYNASLLPAWENTAKLAIESKEKMQRRDGMLAIYYAACIAGIGDKTNGDWSSVNNAFGQDWNDLSDDYAQFPDWQESSPFMDDVERKHAAGWNYSVSSYFYCMGQCSAYSKNSLFDGDYEEGSMHADRDFTVNAAIKSVVRLYECLVDRKSEPRIADGWDTAFLEGVKQKEAGIINRQTSIVKAETYTKGETYTGTAYYISSINGKDDNDGTTLDTPWKSLYKLDEIRTSLKEGDAVFFERGSVWREELACEPGVTYSAYGTGEKPAFYGSQKNGTGTENWTLYKTSGDAKIWKFNQSVTECGGIVFNDGESYASRVYSEYDGTKMISVTDGTEFVVEEQLKKDLQFCDIYSLEGNSLPICVYDVDTTGSIYLRCDSGNPGEVYRSIEFQTSPKTKFGYHGLVNANRCYGSELGCVIDNLCVKYVDTVGIKTQGNDNVLIQNCEVAWIGGNSLGYDGKAGVPAAGEGIATNGNGTIVRNCYIHDCFDGGLNYEPASGTNDSYSNIVIDGNLVERCMSGIFFGHTDAETIKLIHNFSIKNNYFLYSGYGWSSDENYDFTWKNKNYEGTSLNFLDIPNCNDGIYVENNVLYLAKSSLIHCAMDKDNYPHLSGNTYVQDRYGRFAYWKDAKGQMEVYPFYDSAEAVNQILGDKTAVVIPTNGTEAQIVTAPEIKEDLIYTGKSQELITGGTASNGTLQYKVDDGTWSEDITTETDAGNYDIYYKAAGSTNYNGISETLSGTVSIGKYSVKAADIQVDGVSKDYDGTTEFTGTVKIKKNVFGNEEMVEIPSDKICVTYDSKNAGERVITISGENGYEEDERYIIPAEFEMKTAGTILKINPTVESVPKEASVVYKDNLTLADAELGLVGWKWSNPTMPISIKEGTMAAQAQYIQEDTVNYETLTADVTVTVTVCTHKDTEVRDFQEATCTEKGYTGDTYCTYCGTKIETGKEINALGHKWGEWKVITSATYETEGVETRECSACHKTETRAIAKLTKPADDTPVIPAKKADTIVVRQKIDVSGKFSENMAKYSVSPKGSASVTKKGIVTAKKAGTVTVTAYTKSGKTYTAVSSCEINIEKPVFAAMTATKPGVVINGYDKLTGITTAADSWKSSNTGVAAVDTNGQITTAGKGTTKISATFGEGSNKAIYTATLKVNIPVINKKKLTMITGAAAKLKLNNTKATVTWSSLSSDIAAVDSTGKVTALKYGTTAISGTVDGVAYSCELTVKAPAIKKAAITVKAGRSTKIGLKNTRLKPSDWKSSDTAVATVDASGKVTGVKAGTAVISTETGGVHNECTAEVR